MLKLCCCPILCTMLGDNWVCCPGRAGESKGIGEKNPIFSSSNRSQKSETLLPAFLLIRVSERAIIFVLWNVQNANLPWCWVGGEWSKGPSTSQGAVSSAWGFGNISFLNKRWKSHQNNSLILLRAFFYFDDSRKKLCEAVPINNCSAPCKV